MVAIPWILPWVLRGDLFQLKEDHHHHEAGLLPLKDQHLQDQFVAAVDWEEEVIVACIAICAAPIALCWSWAWRCLSSLSTGEDRIDMNSRPTWGDPVFYFCCLKCLASETAQWVKTFAVSQAQELESNPPFTGKTEESCPLTCIYITACIFPHHTHMNIFNAYTQDWFTDSN